MGLTKEQIQQSIEALGVPVNVRGEALSLAPVSYTHLDVYKRQIQRGTITAY